MRITNFTGTATSVFTKSKLKDAKGGRSAYKTDNEYINAVYNKNKKKIDEVFSDRDAKGNKIQIAGRTPYKLFKMNVEELMSNKGGNYTADDAVKIIGRREYFYTDKNERYIDQSYAIISEDKNFKKALSKAYHDNLPQDARTKYLTKALVERYKPEGGEEVFKLYYINKNGEKVYSGIYYKQEYQGENHEWVWTIGNDNGETY